MCYFLCELTIKKIVDVRVPYKQPGMNGGLNGTVLKLSRFVVAETDCDVVHYTTMEERDVAQR